MKSGQRIFKILFALAMVVGSISVATNHNVYAEAGSITNQTELASAINSANDGDTITLTEDIALTSTLNINKNITLDGNGHTMSGTISGTNLINVTASNTAIRNIVFNNASRGDVLASGSLVNVTSTTGTFSFTGNTVNGNVLGFYNVVGLNIPTAVVSGNTFNRSDYLNQNKATNKGIWDIVELSQNASYATVSSTFSNNTVALGSQGNNVFCVYYPADGAEITVENNSIALYASSNAIRLSNYGSKTATFNICDNSYTIDTSLGDELYAGFILLQQVGTYPTSDDFRKYTLNINNLMKDGNYLSEVGDGYDKAYYYFGSVGNRGATINITAPQDLVILDNQGEDGGVIVTDSTYDLSLTINGVTISGAQLADVTWTTEVIAGFNPLDSYIETTNGSSIVNMVKSGVVKVTATYNGNEASIVIVKAGDIDKSGTIDYDDLANLVDYIKSDNLEDLASNTEYVKYLADFNGDGFIDYDDVADLIDIIKGVN